MAAAELAAQRKVLLIDVTRLLFCDAAGLGSLLGAHHDALSNGGVMVVRGVNVQLLRLLELAALAEVLFIIDEAERRHLAVVPSAARAPDCSPGVVASWRRGVVAPRCPTAG